MKPQFECEVCHEPKFKKELSVQTYKLIIKHPNANETRHYSRTVCAKCSKSRWEEDGIVLRKGKSDT